jgi:hypothetical protein
MQQWTQRFRWADEMFSRITEAINDRDTFRLYNLIADVQPNGLGDRASAREALDAMDRDDDGLRIGMVIGLLHSCWDDTSQEWPTVADISPEA